MADLFDLTDLPSYLQIPEIDTETAIRARRHASGWLKSATKLTDWPDPVPDDLWAWGIELAAIAYRNPDGAASESLDDHNVSWDRARRVEILTAARSAYVGATGPSHSFPDWDWHWVSTDVTALAVE